MNTDIYTVEEIAPGTFRLDECGRDNCYLLCGEERALLIDCSLGAGDLLRAVRRLTDLPLTVAVTHTHGDHAGGGYQFGTIHVPRAETHDSFRGQNLRVFRRMLLSNRMKRAGITNKNIRGSIRKTVWLPFDDGAVFDLGGRTVRAVSVPAHTVGGTVFLDETNRLAFLGDTACPVLPMHTYRALPLSAWEAQGDRLLALTDGYAYSTVQPRGTEVDLTGDVFSVAKQALVKDGKLNNLAASVNPCNVQLKFARATGIVTGTFALWSETGDGSAQKQITGIKHNGVLLLSRDAASPLPDDVLTAGFFTQPVKLPGRTWTFSAPFNILGAESE